MGARQTRNSRNVRDPEVRLVLEHQAERDVPEVGMVLQSTTPSQVSTTSSLNLQAASTSATAHNKASTTHSHSIVSYLSKCR